MLLSTLRRSVRELWYDNARVVSSAAGAAAGATTAAAGAGAKKAAHTPSWTAIVLFVPSGICAYLAAWQYQRSQWKEELIKVRTSALAEDEAADIFSVRQPSPYQKVTAEGMYRNEDSVYVGPRPRSIPGIGMQSGYMVFTPMYNKDRTSAVLINRGWVPSSWRGHVNALPDGAALVPDSKPAESAKSSSVFWGKKKSEASASSAAPKLVYPTVSQQCIVMQSETPSLAVLQNDAEKGDFHWVDTDALVMATGLPAGTPVLQAISSDPSTQTTVQSMTPLESQRRHREAMMLGPTTFPIPKNASDLVKFGTMPTDHLIYCATWTSLCVVLGIMALNATFRPTRSFRIVQQDNRALWKNNAT